MLCKTEGVLQQQVTVHRVQYTINSNKINCMCELYSHIIRIIYVEKLTKVEEEWETRALRYRIWSVILKFHNLFILY